MCVFTNCVKELENKHVPRKEIDVNKSKNWTIPMDFGNVQHVRKKSTLWKKYMRTKDEQTYLYCKIRNKVQPLTRKLKKECETNTDRETKRNPKQVWNYHMKSRIKVKETISSLYLDVSNLVDGETGNDKEKAKALADFFAKVFTIEPLGELLKVMEYVTLNAVEELTMTGYGD